MSRGQGDGRGQREAAQIVRCGLRLARGGKERARIGLEQRNPVADIAGVAKLARKIKFGAKECGGKLGDKLLGSISLLAEPTAQVTVKPRLVARPMSLMPISA